VISLGRVLGLTEGSSLEDVVGFPLAIEEALGDRLMTFGTELVGASRLEVGSDDIELGVALGLSLEVSCGGSVGFSSMEELLGNTDGLNVDSNPVILLEVGTSEGASDLIGLGSAVRPIVGVSDEYMEGLLDGLEGENDGFAFGLLLGPLSGFSDKLVVASSVGEALC
jgi:hypothetical protein